MLMALTSGHRGCWSTCHAQSPLDALHRLSALVMRGSPQWTDAVVHRTISSAIDYVIFVERSHDGGRGVSFVGRVITSSSGELSVQPIYAVAQGNLNKADPTSHA